MVDIMDMEQIFKEILYPYMGGGLDNKIIKLLIVEVEDFVEAQQTIKCNNCDDRSEDSFSETRRIMMEDRD